MYTALDIANWFIAYDNAEFRSNETLGYNVYERLIYSKLQMLLYLAQGVYMNYNKGKLNKIFHTHVNNESARYIA